MKYIILITIFVTTICAQDYNWNAHMYTVLEAWEYLKIQKPNINWNATDMANHVGDYNGGSDDYPWALGTITCGAYREDREDPVYELDWKFFGLTTASHFWDADAGNNWRFCPQPGWLFQNLCADNAMLKAQIYTQGGTGRKIYFHCPSSDPIYGQILGRYYSFVSLIDFYQTGRCYYWGHKDLAGYFQHIFNPPLLVYLDIQTRKIWSYLILGRIAHLLSDMGVPAHVHGDQHDQYYGGRDRYEDFMSNSNNYGQWNRYLNPLSPPTDLGPTGIIIPYCDNTIYYLFFLNNQVADRFPSDEYDGDLSFSSYDDVNRYLNPIYSSINYHNIQTTHPPPQNVNWNPYADHCFNNTIKCVASLLYWFAKNTFQFPVNPIPNNITLSSTLQGNELYKEETGTLVISGLGNATDPCYEWYLYVCNSSIPTIWPLNLYTIQTLTGIYSPNFKIINNDYGGQGCPSNDATFFLRVKCKVKNNAGPPVWTNQIIITPRCGYRPIAGCPYVNILSLDTSFVVENNILHRSEFPENINVDIKDLYKLRTSPLFIDDNIIINITESETDHSYFDQFKLYAIDHQPGTRVGITESNKIVVYDSLPVIDNIYSTLNGEEITNYILFHQPNRGMPPLPGDSLDHIYSLYPENITDHPAIITELEYNDHIGPHPVKYIAGTINAYTNVGNIFTNFARRESPAEVIIPIENLGIPVTVVNNLNIDYYRNYKVKYIALTSLTYEGFDTTELTLIEAIHSDSGDVLQKLINLDQVYAEMNNQASILLKFHIPISEPTMPVREYILETNGRYVKIDSGDYLTKFKSQTSPYKFALHQNYPNPFNPITRIKYSIPKQVIVKLVIYDLLGREVKTLVNEIKQAGHYEAEFNGQNLASGVYFYKLEAGDFTETKKMVLIK